MRLSSTRLRKVGSDFDALYGNELTALCRPEELVRLVDYAGQLREQYGVTIESAMITDVPGYTWGLIPVLADTPVKYFCVGPNRGHRIGYTLSTWGDKPFFWQSPSGKSKVLTWVAGEGVLVLPGRSFGQWQALRLPRPLEQDDYPYDMVHLRYAIVATTVRPIPSWLTTFASGMRHTPIRD